MNQGILFKGSLRGIAWMALDALIMSFILMSGKLLGDHAYNPLQIVFLVNLVAATLNFAMHARAGLKTFRPRSMQLHLRRACFGVASTSCTLAALQTLTLFEASAIGLLVPAVTFVTSMLSFQKTRAKTMFLPLAISVVGVAVVLLSTHDSKSEFHLIGIGSLYGLAAMVLSVLNNLNNKKISDEESIESSIIWGCLYSSLLSLPIALYFWTPLDTRSTILFSLYGVLLAARMRTRYLAFKGATVTTLMPIEYLQLVFSSLLAFTIFDQVISMRAAAGMGLVIIGVLLLIRGVVVRGL